MNKVIISAITASLLLGFSQVGEAKEHKGPKADRGSSYSSSSAHDRGSRQSRNSQRDSSRPVTRRAGADRHNIRHDRKEHRYSDNVRRHVSHDKRSRSHDRYRNHHRPRYKHTYYKHYHPRTYPVSVYYLGQDWHYYGGYYHPFPKHHIHTRFCHHRYWEPLAVGIILGTVLGW